MEAEEGLAAASWRATRPMLARFEDGDCRAGWVEGA